MYSCVIQVTEGERDRVRLREMERDAIERERWRQYCISQVKHPLTSPPSPATEDAVDRPDPEGRGQSEQRVALTRRELPLHMTPVAVTTVTSRYRRRRSAGSRSLATIRDARKVHAPVALSTRLLFCKRVTDTRHHFSTRLRLLPLRILIWTTFLLILGQFQGIKPIWAQVLWPLQMDLTSGRRIGIAAKEWDGLYYLEGSSTQKNGVRKAMGTTDEVVDCSHGKQLWELCKEKYEPLWVSGGGHCNLELYPEFIKHLKKFVQTISNSKATANGSQKDTAEKTVNQSNTAKESEGGTSDTTELVADLPEASRNSLDSSLEKSKKSNKPEKSRMSTDHVDRFRRKKGLIW